MTCREVYVITTPCVCIWTSFRWIYARKLWYAPPRQSGQLTTRTSHLGKEVNNPSWQKYHLPFEPGQDFCCIKSLYCPWLQTETRASFVWWSGNPKPSSGAWYFVINKWTCSIVFSDLKQSWVTMMCTLKMFEKITHRPRSEVAAEGVYIRYLLDATSTRKQLTCAQVERMYRNKPMSCSYEWLNRLGTTCSLKSKTNPWPLTLYIGSESWRQSMY